MTTRERTWKEHERQAKRDGSGKYRLMNPCEVCGKSAGADYYSEPHVDGVLHGRGLVLCGRCATRLDRLTLNETLAVFDLPAIDPPYVLGCPCSKRVRSRTR